jgi:hypothetical protein
MNNATTAQVLQAEASIFEGTGGVSANNRDRGFRPAFLDTVTGIVYLSRFSDGRLAPFHLIDGLPGHLVIARSACGKVEAVKSTVMSGFVRSGRFYTREEAAQIVAELH